MQRVLLLGVLIAFGCYAIPPFPPSPEITAPTSANITVQMVAVTLSTTQLPGGGGTVRVHVYAAGETYGLPAVPHTQVKLTATAGTLTQAELLTDQTGNASTEWTGNRSADIVATADGVTARATITVADPTASGR